MNRTYSESSVLERYKSQGDIENFLTYRKDMPVNATVTPARLEDVVPIHTLQSFFPELGYNKESIEYLLNLPDSINLLVRGGNSELIGLSLGYPAVHYHEVLKNMPWTISDVCPELKDENAFYLELKVIHPFFQGRGVYKFLRSTNELAIAEAGFDKIFLHSVESAREIHKKECTEEVRELPGFWIDHERTNAYLMRIDLDEIRLAKNQEHINNIARAN